MPHRGPQQTTEVVKLVNCCLNTNKCEHCAKKVLLCSAWSNCLLAPKYF